MPYVPPKTNAFDVLAAGLQGTDVGLQRSIAKAERDRAFAEGVREFDVGQSGVESRFSRQLEESRRAFDVGVEQTAEQNRLQRKLVREQMTSKEKMESARLSEATRAAKAQESLQWAQQKIQKTQQQLQYSEKLADATTHERTIAALNQYNPNNIPKYSYINENGVDVPIEDPNTLQGSLALNQMHINPAWQKSYDSLVEARLGNLPPGSPLRTPELEKTTRDAVDAILRDEKGYRRAVNADIIKLRASEAFGTYWGKQSAEEGRSPAEIGMLQPTPIPAYKAPDASEYQTVMLRGNPNSPLLEDIPESAPMQMLTESYYERLKAEYIGANDAIGDIMTLSEQLQGESHRTIEDAKAMINASINALPTDTIPFGVRDILRQDLENSATIGKHRRDWGGGSETVVVKPAEAKAAVTAAAAAVPSQSLVSQQQQKLAEEKAKAQRLEGTFSEINKSLREGIEPPPNASLLRIGLSATAQNVMKATGFISWPASKVYDFVWDIGKLSGDEFALKYGVSQSDAKQFVDENPEIANQAGK